MHSPLRLALALLLLSLPSLPLFAHGGGLDRYGCHTNRKTGEYHCHRAPAAPQPRNPPRAVPPSRNPRPTPLFSPPTGKNDAPCSSSGDLVLSAQLLLGALGYDTGIADGMASATTQREVRRFQYRHGLTIDGEINGRLLVELSRVLSRKHSSPSQGDGR